MAKMTDEEKMVISRNKQIKKLYSRKKDRPSMSTLSKQFGVAKSTIHRVVHS